MVSLRIVINLIFSSIWIFFHEHLQITGLQGKGKGISLSPHYDFHPLHRHLDISRAIIAESSPLQVASSWTLMMICRWTTLMSQHGPENDHKRQCICRIRHEKMRVVRPVFQICLFYSSQTRDSTLDPIKLHYFTKQWSTRFSFFVMICAHRTKYCYQNNFQIPGGQLSFFHALFGRCTTFYGHFLVHVVTSE